MGRQFIDLSDGATRISSRLKLATDSAEELAKAQERLFEVSQKTRTSFESNAELFQKFERSTRTLNLSQEQLFTITERIGKAVAISGSSALSANAAIQQFTQGLASGQLRGQELNAVLEQATPILELLAQNLNIPIGKFRELAEQGFFTAEKIVEGLLVMGEGTKNLEKDFSEVAITADSAFITLKNALLKAVGAFNEGSGASELLSSAIIGIAKAIEKTAPLFLALGENTARGFREIFENTVRGFREIEEAVKRLFSGLDEFFGGRLSSIVESVVRKVGEIGEAFRRLLDDVVGNSFVPELLAGIEKEFRGLDAVMVRPVEEATRRVSSSFGNLGSSVSQSVTDTIGSLSNSFSSLARMIGDLSQVGSLFGFRGFRNLGATIGGIGQIASFGGGLLDKFQIGGLGGLLGGFQSKGLSSLLVGAGGALGLGRGAIESLGVAGLNAPFGFLGGL
ncbi:MAG: tape measure protein, partial [Acidobacteria bacterium]|nr:tape measure protein [Acidobacteriota bacterium]